MLLDSLELILQEDVSCPKWVLEPKPWSLQEQSAFLTTESSFQVLVHFFIFQRQET